LYVCHEKKQRGTKNSNKKQPNIFFHHLRYCTVWYPGTVLVPGTVCIMHSFIIIVRCSILPSECTYILI
jgi:hypothetical protein